MATLTLADVDALIPCFNDLSSMIDNLKRVYGQIPDPTDQRHITACLTETQTTLQILFKNTREIIQLRKQFTDIESQKAKELQILETRSKEHDKFMKSPQFEAISALLHSLDLDPSNIRKATELKKKLEASTAGLLEACQQTLDKQARLALPQEDCKVPGYPQSKRIIGTGLYLASHPPGSTGDTIETQHSITIPMTSSVYNVMKRDSNIRESTTTTRGHIGIKLEGDGDARTLLAEKDEEIEVLKRQLKTTKLEVASLKVEKEKLDRQAFNLKNEKISLEDILKKEVATERELRLHAEEKLEASSRDQQSSSKKRRLVPGSPEKGYAQNWRNVCEALLDFTPSGECDFHQARVQIAKSLSKDTQFINWKSFLDVQDIHEQGWRCLFVLTYSGIGKSVVIEQNKNCSFCKAGSCLQVRMENDNLFFRLL